MDFIDFIDEVWTLNPSVMILLGSTHHVVWNGTDAYDTPRMKIDIRANIHASIHVERSVVQDVGYYPKSVQHCTVLPQVAVRCVDLYCRLRNLHQTGSHELTETDGVSQRMSVRNDRC